MADLIRKSGGKMGSAFRQQYQLRVTVDRSIPVPKDEICCEYIERMTQDDFTKDVFLD